MSYPRGSGVKLAVGVALAALALALPARALYAEEPTLDQLLNITPPPPADPGTPKGVPPTDPQAKPQPEISTKQASDLFAQAVQQMDDSAEQLSQELDPGIETQRIQESIIRKLDQVIAKARADQQKSSSSSSSSSSSGKQQKQDQGSAGNSSRAGDQQPGGKQPGQGEKQAGQPGGDSNENLDHGDDNPGGVAKSGELFEGRDSWGNLPPRLRDELMQGLSEKYSSVYRALTEKYYRRLAQEESP